MLTEGQKMAEEKPTPRPAASGTAAEMANLMVLQEIEKALTAIARHLDGIRSELKNMNQGKAK